MKIALCFSGMARTFQECIPSVITHIIQENPGHQFDSFISIWDIHGKNPVWWEVSKDNTPVDLNKLMEFKKDLNIKRLLVDTYENSDFMKKTDIELGGIYKDRKGPSHNPTNFIPMLKRMEWAHILMLDNGANYDIVVKLRTDLLFNGRVVFTLPQPKTVYMPTHECWGPGNLNDQFLYGDGHVMSFHASMYKNLEALYIQENTLHPETLLHKYYTIHGINVERHEVPYRILR
jgi:hypothetical protein